LPDGYSFATCKTRVVVLFTVGADRRSNCVAMTTFGLIAAVSSEGRVACGDKGTPQIGQTLFLVPLRNKPRAGALGVQNSPVEALLVSRCRRGTFAKLSHCAVQIVDACNFAGHTRTLQSWVVYVNLYALKIRCTLGHLPFGRVSR